MLKKWAKMQWPKTVVRRLVDPNPSLIPGINLMLLHWTDYLMEIFDIPKGTTDHVCMLHSLFSSHVSVCAPIEHVSGCRFSLLTCKIILLNPIHLKSAIASCRNPDSKRKVSWYNVFLCPWLPFDVKVP